MFERLQASASMRRIIDLWENHEHYFTGSALVIGFIFDLWVAKRPDSIFDNLLLLNYLVIAGVLIIVLNLRTTRREQIENPAQPLLLLFLLSFCFGGLSSNLLVLYGRSGTFAGSAIFVAILLAMFLGNEAFRNKYEQMRFHIAAYYLLLFTYLMISLPTFIIHQVGAWVFLLSGLVSLIYISAFLWLVYYLVLRGRHRRRQLIEVSIYVAAIFFVFNIFYFLNIIPPVPLSMKDVGIYHSVVHDASGDYAASFEAPEWYAFWRDTSATYHLAAGDNTAYCFSSVFAPTGLSASIVHSWEKYNDATKKWDVEARVSYAINGGNAEGYRGFSTKTLTAGAWRCDVETPGGQLIGRIQFTATAATPAPALTSKTL